MELFKIPTNGSWVIPTKTIHHRAAENFKHKQTDTVGYFLGLIRDKSGRNPETLSLQNQSGAHVHQTVEPHLEKEQFHFMNYKKCKLFHIHINKA